MVKDSFTEIEKVVTNYFYGLFYGDVKKLNACFHKNLYVYGDIEGTSYLKRRDEFLEEIQIRKSPNELGEPFGMEIIGIDLWDKIAVVKTHILMFEYNFYDFLSLNQINGEWMIVCKMMKAIGH